jgi:hypothetical protein
MLAPDITNRIAPASTRSRGNMHGSTDSKYDKWQGVRVSQNTIAHTHTLVQNPKRREIRPVAHTVKEGDLVYDNHLEIV